MLCFRKLLKANGPGQAACPSAGTTALAYACGKTPAPLPPSASAATRGKAGGGRKRRREPPARVAARRSAPCNGMPIGPRVEPVAGRGGPLLAAALLNAPAQPRSEGRNRTGGAAAAALPPPAASARTASAMGAGMARSRRGPLGAGCRLHSRAARTAAPPPRAHGRPALQEASRDD